MTDEQEKHRKLAKNYKYKNELEAQLHERDRKAKLEQHLQQNPLDQKMLYDDYRKFEQKEFERTNDGRMKTKQVMSENKHVLQQKVHEHNSMNQQDKDVFNRQALEDKLHAEKTAEERRRWQEWQRESLKKDYDDKIKHKEDLQRMEKEKERVYANEFKHSVETFENNHNHKLDTLRKRNMELMDHQQNQIIPDVNARRKEQAMDNMKQQFDNTEKETLIKELSRLNQRNNAAKETSDTLKFQMNIRKQKNQSATNEDQNYKSYIDNTLNLLGERDRKVEEERKRNRASYAKELESQIKEHNELQKKMYNEMDERDMTINQKGLIAYEIGDRSTNLFKLPGVDRDTQNDKEYFGRYARKQEPSKLGAEIAMSHRGGYDTNSHGGSIRHLTSNNLKTLPYSPEKFTKEIPRTSEEYYARGRRSSRDINQIREDTNILGQPSEGSMDKQIHKYNSLANLPSTGYSKNSPSGFNNTGIGLIPSKNSNLLSPRDYEEPEYKPIIRQPTEKRDYQVAETARSLAVMPKLDESKHVTINPVAISTPVNQREKKVNKFKQAPSSLQDINNRLNQRIIGSMRAGNLSTSKDNYTYGNGGSITHRGYSSSMN
jgi:hypothetical protein